MTIKEKHKGDIKLIYGSVVPLIRQQNLSEIMVYSGYDFPETYGYSGIVFNHIHNGSNIITFSDNIESIIFEP